MHRRVTNLEPPCVPPQMEGLVEVRESGRLRQPLVCCRRRPAPRGVLGQGPVLPWLRTASPLSCAACALQLPHCASARRRELVELVELVPIRAPHEQERMQARPLLASSAGPSCLRDSRAPPHLPGALQMSRRGRVKSGALIYHPRRPDPLKPSWDLYRAIQSNSSPASGARIVLPSLLPLESRRCCCALSSPLARGASFFGFPSFVWSSLEQKSTPRHPTARIFFESTASFAPTLRYHDTRVSCVSGFFFFLSCFQVSRSTSRPPVPLVLDEPQLSWTTSSPRRIQGVRYVQPCARPVRGPLAQPLLGQLLLTMQDIAVIQ